MIALRSVGDKRKKSKWLQIIFLAMVAAISSNPVGVGRKSWAKNSEGPHFFNHTIFRQ